MIDSNTYIGPEKIEEIKSTAVLKEVVEDFVPLKPKGSAFVGDCRHCGIKEGLTVTQGSKILFKCFHCETGGSNAVNFLTKQIGKSYKEALHYLADKYNIDIEKPIAKKKSKGQKKLSFRDLQLLESSIPNSAQQYTYKDANGVEHIEQNRYVSGSVDYNGEIDTKGDDMVLVYRNLDGKHTTYFNKQKRKVNLYRVRYKVPQAHSDNNDKPRKYNQPYGSGSHVWWPEYVLKQYHAGAKIDTFVIGEGEKKADAMAWLKILMAGIMGIHNLSTKNGTMSADFGKIIDRNGIVNVLFLLDEDFRDISAKNGKNIDTRSKSFFKAVLKFKRFFDSYVKSGINLQIFFGSHKSDGKHKGVDDLLNANPKKKKEIIEDFHTTINTYPYDGKYFQFYNITSENDYAIKKHWHIHNDTSFLEYHKETLKELFEFKLSGLKWRYNEEDDAFELAQKLMPFERYWIEKRNKDDKLTGFSFDYMGAEQFFKNRGIGIYSKNHEDYKIVHLEDNIVQEVNARYVQLYMLNFTKNLEVSYVRMLSNFMKRGVNQYMSPTQLTLMLAIEPNFLVSDKNRQHMIFNNCFVEVTIDDVKVSNNANFSYWKNQIIDYKFEKLDPLFDLERIDNKWKFTPRAGSEKCDLLKFFFATSCVYWRKTQKISKDEQGNTIFIHKSGSLKVQGVTDDELEQTYNHIASKMLATGYILHNHHSPALIKAIVCNDLKESKAGETHGGSGKSLFSMMFEHYMPIVSIDAAKRDLFSDRFLFRDINEDTQGIVFDDALDDFNFRSIFSSLFGGFEQTKKGIDGIKVGKKKVIINLNGQLKGDTPSFQRRQYHLGFTDYFNLDRNPEQEFGRLMFDEWNHEQWNLTHNFMIQCIQLFLKHGLKYSIPKEVLRRRKIIEFLKDHFIEWAELRWDTTGYWLNNKVEKKYMFNDFLHENPSQRKYMNMQKFKKKVMMYAEYMGYDFNQGKEGGRIKSNGREYFSLSNEKYSESTAEYILTDKFT